MVQALKVVWWSGEQVLFHNAAFDLAVAYRHFNLPGLDWPRVEDTMILAFLCDPYESKLGLKPLAAKHCAWENEDVTLLHQWIMMHADEISAKYDMKVTKKNVGAFICEVPEEMRKRYAMADADRTHALWSKAVRTAHQRRAGRGVQARTEAAADPAGEYTSRRVRGRRAAG